jgi:hypothetical protein
MGMPNKREVFQGRACGTQRACLRYVQSTSKGLHVTDNANPKLDPHPGSNTEKDPDAWVSGDEPMTRAQASYLTTLCEEAKLEPPPQNLTKAEASKRIDELKQKLGR